jgi:hypothetical protein
LQRNLQQQAAASSSKQQQAAGSSSVWSSRSVFARVELFRASRQSRLPSFFVKSKGGNLPLSALANAGEQPPMMAAA